MVFFFQINKQAFLAVCPEKMKEKIFRVEKNFCHFLYTHWKMWYQSLSTELMLIATHTCWRRSFTVILLCQSKLQIDVSLVLGFGQNCLRRLSCTIGTWRHERRYLTCRYRCIMHESNGVDRYYIHDTTRRCKQKDINLSTLSKR